MIEITLEHTTDTGHRIVGHKGKCARLHGHTYRWIVTMEAMQLNEQGFVVDFGDVKEILNEWDHRLLLWEEDPFLEGYDWTFDRLRTDGIETVPFNPTAEKMAAHMAARVMEEFRLIRVDITLWETPKACARVVAE
jgi:6-pyruvoyltetrahydropterin/6-carboxytetrahydropterin synthase